MMVVALAAAGACSSSAPPQAGPAPSPTAERTSIPEAGIGLRTADVLDNGEVQPIRPVTAEPGEAPLPVRPYPSSPPVIPHSVADLLPVTTRENACLDCHLPEAAADSGATAIPASHFARGTLDPRRFVCVLCHAPQNRATPLVENRFTP